MEITTCTTQHLIKSEDLNHHGTLYAGRSAEWLVESGFIAAANLTSPENIVCLKIHGMVFKRPVKRGEILRYDSKIVLAGRTRLVAFIEASVKSQHVVSGFITFIHVDMDGKPLPHGLELVAATPQDQELQAQAAALPD